MKLSEIEKFCSKKQLPHFRARQIYQAVTKNFITSWSDAKELPAEMRQLLSKELPVSSLKIKKILKSKKEDAIKIAFKTSDDYILESVLMRHKGGRNTVCVSTQVGCAMGCKFCATGQLGCKRNLKAEEMADQVLEFARILKPMAARITNVVFMGMGEPFLNYEEALRAIKILHDDSGFNLGVRQMTVSTSGIVPGIVKFAHEPLQLSLAISLHAATDSLRNKLMPINRKYPLTKLLSAVADYMKRTNRKVFFEYILFDHINDSIYDAQKLVELLSGKFKNFRQLVHVNLIEYNPVVGAAIATGARLLPPKTERVKKFQEVLMTSGIPTTIRYKIGRDIQGACGQLSGK